MMNKKLGTKHQILTFCLAVKITRIRHTHALTQSLPLSVSLKVFKQIGQIVKKIGQNIIFKTFFVKDI